MNEQMIWCHIYPLIETNSGDGVQQLEVNASLTLVVYRDYEDAVEAQRIAGGLVLRVPSSSLKGQAEAGCMQTVKSAHGELMEIEEQPSWCHLAVGKSLPFTEVHDPEGNRIAWQFTPEAGDWLSTFVEQSDIEVSL